MPKKSIRKKYRVSPPPLPKGPRPHVKSASRKLLEQAGAGVPVIIEDVDYNWDDIQTRPRLSFGGKRKSRKSKRKSVKKAKKSGKK